MAKIKLPYTKTEMIPYDFYSISNAGNTYFLTFKGETYLSAFFVERTEEPIACFACGNIIYSLSIIVGNNKIRGVIPCTNCKVLTIADFDDQSLREIRKMLRISDELISEKWEETKQPFLA